MKISTFLGIGFWIMLFSLIYMIYIKYLPGIVSFAAILIPFAVLYLYSKKRQTTKERKY